MNWDVICPQSGMVLDSFGALRTLKTHYVCGLCDVTGDTDLDDFISVSLLGIVLRNYDGCRFMIQAPSRSRTSIGNSASRTMGACPARRSPVSGCPAGVGSRPIVLAAKCDHLRFRTELGPGALSGVNVPDTGRAYGAGHWRTHSNADAVACRLRRAALSAPSLSVMPPRSCCHRSRELGNRARLAPPDQLAASRLSLRQSKLAARLRTVHVRGDIACETNLPASVPDRSVVDEREGARHPATVTLPVHGSQGIDGNV